MGRSIDVLASPKRDLAATRQFFARALSVARRPTEVTTDRAPAYPRVLDEVVPQAWHVVEQYAITPI
jgi:transposase, IS6 family